MQAPLPADEEERLKALRRYEILDTEPEREFDDITMLASHICGTPISMITLLDENRQWFKSKVGLTDTETPRDIAFCAHGILQPDVFIIEDARADPRFAASPLVTGNPHVRFYAGAPLRTPDGHALGMLCVADQAPRELSVEQITALRALGRQAGALLELRRSLAEVREAVAGRKEAEEELVWRTAFLEAQAHSSIDAILVVDREGKKILQNQRMADLFGIPRRIAEDEDDREQLQWVANAVANPASFMERIVHLYAHPDETARDEIDLKNGTVLDRYSSPVFGKDQRYYGRIWTFRDMTERKRTEERLRLLGSAVEQAKESIVITDADLESPGPRILFVNPAFTRITGYSAEEALGKTPRILQGAKTDKSLLSQLREALARGEVFEGETVNYRKDGHAFDLQWQVAPLRDTAGKITHFVAIQHDVTERRRMEAHLFQSQKMETVGKLAGGIAHEFNSILTAIIGHSQLLLGDLPPESPLTGNALEITTAANRAAGLTRQLLAYGRKQILQPAPVDLNRVIASMEGIFKHLMGEGVRTQIIPARDLRMVKADAGQIEQVIMNMAINAHDAMPNGGRLILETANVSVDQESIGRYPELPPGEYVMLAITDTGMGMTPEVKARIFEPFFSTKGVGQGTGLGLSTCHGIIKQSGGQISVYSEVARGATFKIYLPQIPHDETQPPIRRLDSPGLPRGTETILLVEDDAALRDMAATLLRRLGYTVWPAANGIEALSLKQKRGIGHIDLLFTDVVMPHMSGRELSERIQAASPHTKTLFTSAFTENAIVHQGVLMKGVALLQKPFTPAALAQVLREVLDKPEDPVETTPS